MKLKRIALTMVALLAAAAVFWIAAPGVLATEADEATQAVIAQLEAIDSLQTMQDNRADYDDAVSYEAYVAKMFAARLAAKAAYEALTPEQQAAIDPALVEKLSEELDTLYYEPTLTVTERTGPYSYEVIFQNRTMYEIGHHVAGEMPCTIILVDTALTGSTWTPDGLYQYGQNNYEVTYCCDAVAPVVQGTHYRRINLEDSGYYDPESASHIRTIILYSYPYLTLEEMKAGLVEGGLSQDFVASLTRGDIISAVQMAVWTYSNSDQEGMNTYAGTIEMTNNKIFRNPIHDYTNELWSWWDTTNSSPGIYDEQAAYRVNTLVYYLCHLTPMAAEEGQVVISDVQVTRAELVPGSDELYTLGVNILLNSGCSPEDALTVTVTTADSGGNVTETVSHEVGSAQTYTANIKARAGDTVTVTVEGTQQLEKGVYFYEPEGGKEESQCLVGVTEGQTQVLLQKSFVFDQPIEKGLEIHKTDAQTRLPLSDIIFHVYKVVPQAGQALGTIPTEAEVTQFAQEENRVGSVTTDISGYAHIALEEGRYLVVEEYDPERVAAPIDPFYLTVPLIQETGAGGTDLEALDVITIYPKNQPAEPTDPDPEIPPVPENVTGHFSILKYDAQDESLVLPGAGFRVYRPATAQDTDTETVTCDGILYQVVPVMDGEAPLELITGADGTAMSPELPCGTYFLVETQVPAGYCQPEECWSVTVVSGEMETAATVSVVNYRGSFLPETGGHGRNGFWALGVLVVAAGAALACSLRRRVR